MSSNDQMRAIMFADVSGSSARYKQVGNIEAKALIDKAINFMRQLTEANHGTVVKTIGDEVMACFDSPDHACLAAIAIQQTCRQTDTEGLAIRIGMSYGPTLPDKGDVFGETVNDAAFVAHIARAEEVVVTQALTDALPPYLSAACQEFDRIHIKGESHKTVIYRLRWETSSQTHSATTVMSIADITQVLDIRYLHLEVNGVSHTITSEQTPYIIGRDQRNAHLYIDTSVASRDHCRIVYRRGKYVLVDHSTNGTYVVTPDQPEIYLRREELPLLGEGTIAIGQPAAQAGAMLIHYSL